MKTVEYLVKADSRTKRGNHEVRFVELNCRQFIYFWTCICEVDDSNMTFTTNNGGYDTQSTNRAINAYVRHFENQGYKNITDEKKVG